MHKMDHIETVSLKEEAQKYFNSCNTFQIMKQITDMKSKIKQQLAYTKRRLDGMDQRIHPFSSCKQYS